MTASGTAGTTCTLLLDWFNQENGTLTDPAAIQLDITFGSVYPTVPDVSGPFTYQGQQGGPGPTQVYRLGTGLYAFDWQIPPNVEPGVYVANWSVTYGAPSNVFLVTEDINVTANFLQVPAGDIGYWTGSLTYNPLWGSYTIPLGAVDANGISWILQKVEGWDGAPAFSGSGGVVNRAADQGGWATSQFYGPRIMTLNVWASAPNQAARDLARALLNQALAISAPLTTFTYNEPVPKFAGVRLNNSAGVKETYANLTEVAFSIPLVAPDPRKYVVGQQSLTAPIPTQIPAPLTLPTTTPLILPQIAPPFAGGTAALAVNTGTFETRPVVTITGPITGPAVSNITQGLKVSFSALTMQASDTLVLNMDARTAKLNGTFIPADLTSAWWTLWPGSNTIQLAGTGDFGATLNATWYSAYV